MPRTHIPLSSANYRTTLLAETKRREFSTKFDTVTSVSNNKNKKKTSHPPTTTQDMVKPYGQHRNIWSHLDLNHHEPEELSDSQITDFYQLATQGEDIDDLASMPSWEDPVSVFFSVTKPEIETILYIRRLVRYAQCSRAAFIIALVYLSRLQEANPKLAITPYNMHRLLITSIMLAAKNLDDRCYSNAHYARVGGIASVREVNRLELQMLALLRFNIFVSPEEYNYFVNCFERKVIPIVSQRIARLHTVFPTETRRSAAVGQPALICSSNLEMSCSRSNSSESSSDEKEVAFEISDSSPTQYQFSAPPSSSSHRVLPLVKPSKRTSSR